MSFNDLMLICYVLLSLSLLSNIYNNSTYLLNHNQPTHSRHKALFFFSCFSIFSSLVHVLRWWLFSYRYTVRFWLYALGLYNLVRKQKLFWQGSVILANVVWLHVNNCCKGAAMLISRRRCNWNNVLSPNLWTFNWVGL